MEPLIPSLNIHQDFLQQMTKGLERIETLPGEYQEAVWKMGMDMALEYFTGDKKINGGAKKLEAFAQEMFSQEIAKALPKTSNSAEACQMKNRVDQIQRKFNVRMHLTSKVAVKQAGKSLAYLEKELTSGIEKICRTVCLAEERQCHPLNLTAEDSAKKADQIVQELIQEENLEKTKKEKTKGSVRKSKKQMSQKSSPAIAKKRTTQVDAPKTAQNPSLNLDARLSQFALKIMEESFKCSEHRRIQRWQTKQCAEIRAFVDVDTDGQQILRYKDLSDEKIQEQRARHFLPGTERLLTDPAYRAIYAFPTDRGFGVVAQLTFNNNMHNGILYFGMAKSQMIFHKYFEDVDFNSAEKNVFQDGRKMDSEEKENASEWSSDNAFTLDISKQGVFQFSYADHQIRIFPIRKDLFDKKIASIH